MGLRGAPSAMGAPARPAGRPRAVLDFRRLAARAAAEAKKEEEEEHEEELQG